MEFQIESIDPASHARAGKFRTGHGEVPTPVFMPVGTGGTVKAVHQRELKSDIDAPIILSNTYHLYLRPGTDVLKAAGGLHRFIGWDRPILTDSGGYQVFSMAENRKLKPEGAWFSSHIDGSRHLFSPENVVEIQRAIGSDLTMAFDECTPWPCDHQYAASSMNLTHDWLARGVEHFKKTEPLYGYEQFFLPIVQGSVFPDLRRQSAEFIASMEMPANAIGGLSVGEPEETMYEMIEVVNGILPANKPRYLMGVGTPVNILEAISRGVDLFDCVMPTRNGRNGMLFTRQGIMNIKNEKWKVDFSPLDTDGACFVDQHYSKAYLRHLIMTGERLGAQIASVHNLAFYLWLVREAREQILAGTFTQWKNAMIPQLKSRL
ncbi:MAG: tRNA guanosine(34) transglycosylase Tgt [Bacteroidales bacterium]|jgi:queuine tRNA-ribosyltransferase|nr:tRNA guanosine(34) transglycosylase Tgt [Bacteroidales bacterium]MDD2571136.1 tRNA guanosine(34) transglycosylase Tgt [Bacteroidales bacterium]MDD3384531.1 tRNA guanosine(34) transglycosylase Tgt [Bacteroidales bacterium]MDD3812681.1 tRNA guanosine(34) transglycosylase Tgt [Bacteroidales bacterium]MDD3871715.1 tRNA guanosine(34) transglycosylase Tgt [Bacteroidales bacterium]